MRVPMRIHRGWAAVAAGVALLAVGINSAFAGGFVRSAAVGGVSIDPEGVLANPEIGSLEQIKAAGESVLDAIPGDMNKRSDLRFVSLRRLEAILAEKAAAELPVPDEVQLMAGLQRITHVLVYPEQGDILLAGPAEGWKMDKFGNVVGSTSNRPVLLLDDFMVALRAAEANPGAGMTCSIDPTAEGMQRAQEIASQLRPNASPRDVAQRLADAMGYQTITIKGVPDSSHFARTMVAADFRMKRLAMKFEAAPVDGLPSYIDLIGRNRGVGNANVQPRWWLAPNYEPLRRDEAGLAWEIRGQGVKCMTAEDHFSESGERTKTTKGNAQAQKWADMFTAKFDDLAAHDSSFGKLRNVMDLAVVATLIVRDGMAEQARLEIPHLSEKASIEVFNAPKRVATQTTFVGKIVTASGGVDIAPVAILEREEKVAAISAAADQESRVASQQSWWWDAR